VGIRVDTGVYQGARVTVHYDPMVAKLVARGSDRAEAIARLRRALSEFVVKGIKTSIPFHLKVVRHPSFLEGHYDTGFIDAHLSEMTEAGGSGESRRVALMLAAVAAFRRDKARTEAASRPDKGGTSESPWRAYGRRSSLRGSLS
jgi:acetyl-CoA carboxylase biotin carboxylase subunit